jgi:hypothetical protein
MCIIRYDMTKSSRTSRRNAASIETTGQTDVRSSSPSPAPLSPRVQRALADCRAALQRAARDPRDLVGRWEQVETQTRLRVKEANPETCSVVIHEHRITIETAQLVAALDRGLLRYLGR